MSQVKHIEIVRKKEAVVERGPKVPQKQKVIVLRRVHKDEEYTKKEEIPVSIGIPQYYQDLQKIEEDRKKKEEEFRKKTIIYLIAEFNCEKDQICEQLHQDFDLGTLKTAALIKFESEKDTKLGKQLQQLIHDKQTIPVEIIIAILKQEIMRQDKDAFLVDDFPMRDDQLIFLEERVCPCKVCIDLIMPDEVTIEKFMAKAQEEAKEDETPEKIKDMIDEYNAPLHPLVDYLHSLNKVAAIDCNRTFEEIYADVKNKVAQFVPPIVEDHPEEEQVPQEQQQETN